METRSRTSIAIFEVVFNIDSTDRASLVCDQPLIDALDVEQVHTRKSSIRTLKLVSVDGE